MKKLKLLSSTLVMTMVSFGVYAADGIITGGAGTCTVDVLKVSDNNATANTIATWSLNDYECGAGQYLDEDTLTCTTCPAGSYCPGGTFTIENASSGTFDCPAGYTESAAGAGTNNECYTVCTVANANIAHATAVSGNDYYGTTDADTCAATDCELGYQVESEIEFYKKAPVIDVDVNLHARGYVYIGGSGNQRNGDIRPDDGDDSFSATDVGLTENNTFASVFDYGVIYGHASCQPTINPAYNYVVNYLSGNFDVESAKAGLDELRATLTPFAGPAKANFIVKQIGTLVDENATTEEKVNATTEISYAMSMFWVDDDVNYSTTSAGQYCFCQVTDYMPNGGNKTAIVNTPWLFEDEYSNCENDCARECAFYLGTGLGTDGSWFNRRNMLGEIDYRITGGMCKITENNCPAGQYLAVVGDAMMCVPCKSGSYCPGGVYTIESENKGTNACPAGYTNSEEGASADTQCYTACTLETANIAHATEVSGNDYYGTGTDTCTATKCVKGYHTYDRIQFVEKTPAVTVDFNTLVGFAAKNGNGEEMNENLPNSGLTENNTIAVSLSNGILYGRASCQPTMDTGAEYMFNNGDAVIDGSMSIEDFRAGLEPLAGVAKTDFAVEYINAMQSDDLTEEEQMQWANKLVVVFLSDKNAGYSTSSTGQYCYVRADAFQPNGGNKSYLAGTPWMLFPEPLFATAEECAANCIMYGAEVLVQMPDVAFGALDYVDVAICAANTINIDWNPDNGGAHTQNMCTYDGEITLPDEPVKVGYTFSGWKLVEPNSTPVQ